MNHVYLCFLNDTYQRVIFARYTCSLHTTSAALGRSRRRSPDLGFGRGLCAVGAWASLFGRHRGQGAGVLFFFFLGRRGVQQLGSFLFETLGEPNSFWKVRQPKQCRRLLI